MSLYVSHQPSGGRGEFEITGSYDLGGGQVIQARDLEDVGFCLDAGPFNVKETGLILGKQGGKYRLRGTGGGSVHFQRHLAALLYLPKSSRDRNQLTGKPPVILRERYVIESAEIRGLRLEDGMATIRFGTLLMLNNPVGMSQSSIYVEFDERVKQIEQLHENVSQLPGGLQNSVAAHRAAVYDDPYVSTAQKAISQTMVQLAELGLEYIEDTDPLPALLSLIGVKTSDMAMIDPSKMAVTEPVVRRQTTSVLRRQRARGAGAAEFRRKIQDAYQFRCIFCGIRLPKGGSKESPRSPGVDAAHILPWSDYELDEVDNGISLCKVHHWAFDEGLLLLRVEGESSYTVEINPSVIQHLNSELRIQLEKVEGPIDEDLLPSDRNNWPNPLYIDMLNKAICDKVSGSHR